ncbi:MAG: outer membrane beta-barrel protein [Planctomycetota bacterium]|jgi:hypothetical protein|nr:outer membrane beta-barrel protein [Planctomycetota bacterium]
MRYFAGLLLLVPLTLAAAQPIANGGGAEDGWISHLGILLGARSMTDGAWNSADTQLGVGFMYDIRDDGAVPGVCPVGLELGFMFNNSDEESWKVQGYEVSVGAQYPWVLSRDHELFASVGGLVTTINLVNRNADYKERDTTFGAYLRAGYRWTFNEEWALSAEGRGSLTGNLDFPNGEEATASALGAFLGFAYRM